MGFSFKGGLVVQPGGEQRLPLPTTEASVLNIEWNIEDNLEVDFTLNFVPEGKADSSELLSAQKKHSTKNAVSIDGPGSLTLVWNNCYVGWMGGAPRKVAYTANLNTKAAVREEEERQAAEAAEAKRLEDERIEAERKRLEQEKEEARLAAREAKIEELQATGASLQENADTMVSSIEKKQAEVLLLQSQLASLAESIKEDGDNLGGLREKLDIHKAERDALCHERDMETECGVKEAAVHQDVVMNGNSAAPDPAAAASEDSEN